MQAEIYKKYFFKLELLWISDPNAEVNAGAPTAKNGITALEVINVAKWYGNINM